MEIKIITVGLGILNVILAVVNGIYANQAHKISVNQVLIYAGLFLAAHIISIWLLKTLPKVSAIIDWLLVLAAFSLMVLALGIVGNPNLQATGMVLLFLNLGVIFIRFPNILNHMGRKNPSQNG